MSPSLQPQWVFEVTVFLLVWAILLGVARIETRSGHIRVEFLPTDLGPRVRVAVEILALLAGIGVAALFVYAGWLVVRDAMLWDERNESVLRLPFWIFYATLSCSFFVHLLFIIERLWLGLSGSQPTAHGLSD